MDVTVTDQISSLTGLSVKLVTATRTEILNKLNQVYDHDGISVATAGRTGGEEESTPWDGIEEFGPASTVDHAPAMAEAQNAVQLIERVLRDAVDKGATDVHIDPGEKDSIFRFRIDGLLREECSVPMEMHPGVLSRIKIMSNLNIAESRVPQDGKASFSFGSKEVNLRVSTFPTIRGERLVIRILDKDQLNIGLDRLGFSPVTLEAFREVIAKPRGIILVTGPTGSGKTTTLYSALGYFNSEEQNIITIEDPVEYDLPGIAQSQVNLRAGITFSSGLRAMLRQDPDVVLIGEIRDKETMEIALRGALTGHLVLGTLHTNDAVGSIPRLLDMGAEPFLLSSSLLAVLAQRLVRLICPRCKVPYQPKPGLRKLLGVEEEVLFYKGKGCTSCDYTGYKGRVGIFELLQTDDRLRQLINGPADSASLQKAARAAGMETMSEDGLRKAIAGATTLEEVLRATAV
jgi:type IV pilus assembly protein PilB